MRIVVVALSGVMIGELTVATLRFFESLLSKRAYSYSANAETLILALLIAYIYMAVATEANTRAKRGKVWTCTLTEDHYVVVDENGTQTKYPWRRMRLALETPEMMRIEVRKRRLAVFRQPLQEAGLEPEFRRHLSVGSAAS